MLTEGTTLAEMIAAKIDEANKFAARATKQVEVITALQSQGIATGHNGWDIQYNCNVEVEKKDLTAVRKIVGRLRLAGKCVAHDFDRTNEICITLKPMAEEYSHITFAYRSKYRAGGKCRVVSEVREASSYQTLVCEK